MKNDLISIVMPSYNTDKFIKDAIQSVVSQTYKNWELIIVDDCSDDNTLEVVRGFNDKRIRLFIAKKNCGAAKCRNKALYEAKGRWIAFLDSDDVWFPDKLGKQISFMKKRNIHFSYTKYKKIDEDSRDTGICVSGPSRIKKGRMYNYCWPGCLTVMFDANILPDKLKIANIKKNNDYAMWLFITKYADCYLLDDVLAEYRLRNGSISREKSISLIKWHFRLFHEAEKMGVLRSLNYTARNLFFGMMKKILFEKRFEQPIGEARDDFMQKRIGGYTQLWV